MHPPFFKIMDEIQEGLRYVFQTSSKYTLLISSSGHGGMQPPCSMCASLHGVCRGCMNAEETSVPSLLCRCMQATSPHLLLTGMEACIANLLEPGETIVVGNNGIWGARVVDMAGRFGGAQLSGALRSSPGQNVVLPHRTRLPVRMHAPPTRCKRLVWSCTPGMRPPWRSFLAPPAAANVVNLEKPVGHAYKFEELKAAVEQHKPAVLFLCQVRGPSLPAQAPA